MVAASRMDGRDMVRQRASAGGRRNVVQTAHDLRRISLLTDTPRTRFRRWRKRVFIDRSAFIDHLCSPYLSPQ
ncbi:putative cytoplasmic protein [Salmonella enterica subsp. enterica serovar Rubislaw str. A4-653]|uniref:Putative cytoplasmic protein n=1 Tax=Salmonella enterica subsp. enterica serovar Rubislaw str. A4-653 TaxID=913081 RepID=G5QEB1_SALRU|nr:putative cytoplasmic protein [Salmonella enterica subsp. enterica serovar Rubislaw str. A4-653]